MNGSFLSAEWRHLVMLNYLADPDLLRSHVPAGTELDSFQGKTFLSLVGFRFLNTRVFGVPIPFHRDFDEVNLRFYVRRETGGAVRRGVVFLREVVPRYAIAQVARLVYEEPYISLPMRHKIERNESIHAEYEWRFRGSWNRLHAHATGSPARAEEASIEQFISEHYWGYTAQRRGGSIEYQVAHEPWRVWMGASAGFEGDTRALYGNELGAMLEREPDSAFIAEGSPVIVFRGTRIA